MNVRNTEELKKELPVQAKFYQYFLQISKDDPDYCGWVQQEGQSAGGRIHLLDNMVVLLIQTLLDQVARGIGILSTKMNGQRKSSDNHL